MPYLSDVTVAGAALPLSATSFCHKDRQKAVGGAFGSFCACLLEPSGFCTEGK
jgi:hypothetical protein